MRFFVEYPFVVARKSSITAKKAAMFVSEDTSQVASVVYTDDSSEVPTEVTSEVNGVEVGKRA